MGKKLEDLLKLDDTPIQRPVEARDDDPRDTAWYQFVGEIEDLLAGDGYVWATDSLTGIRDTVERTRRVTEGQRRAVANITARGETMWRGQTRRWW